MHNIWGVAHNTDAMRYLRLVVDTLVLVFAVLVQSQQSPLKGDRLQVSLNEGSDESLGDEFAYDVVARTNEGVLSNIDAADLALLAVLAAIAAVTVFGIDKLRELAAPWEAVAYALLGMSAAACIVGYFIGLFKTREPIEPRAFLIDFAQRPEETTGIVTLGTVRAYYVNAADRRAKRLAVALALALLVLGTIVIALARSGVDVIPCAP